LPIHIPPSSEGESPVALAIFFSCRQARPCGHEKFPCGMLVCLLTLAPRFCAPRREGNATDICFGVMIGSMSGCRRAGVAKPTTYVCQGQRKLPGDRQQLESSLCRQGFPDRDGRRFRRTTRHRSCRVRRDAHSANSASCGQGAAGGFQRTGFPRS